MSLHQRHIATLLTLAASLMSGVLVAQSTSVTILDSNGNTAFGTVNNGNVFFHDSSGHTTSGTIRGGNVFLSTDKGEVTFGTVRDGNVFLSDLKGITTGTIRNGNIFLSNSDGSITTGSYDSYGNAHTLTTAPPLLGHIATPRHVTAMAALSDALKKGRFSSTSITVNNNSMLLSLPVRQSERSSVDCSGCG